MEKTMTEAFSCSTISLVGFLLVVLIIFNWLIMPHFHSNFRYALLHVFLCVCNVMQINFWSESSKTVQKRRCIDQPSKELGPNENVEDDKKQLCIGELGPIMEKLGTILCDADGSEVADQGRLGSKEIADLFEVEPSLEEVQEAFHVYDENKDGFIDAGEIKKVLSALGFAVVSEVECRRMIKPFDDDGDGRIDFKEFVQLMENSFC